MNGKAITNNKVASTLSNQADRLVAEDIPRYRLEYRRLQSSLHRKTGSPGRL